MRNLLAIFLLPALLVLGGCFVTPYTTSTAFQEFVLPPTPALESEGVGIAAANGGENFTRPLGAGATPPQSGGVAGGVGGSAAESVSPEGTQPSVPAQTPQSDTPPLRGVLLPPAVAGGARPPPRARAPPPTHPPPRGRVPSAARRVGAPPLPTHPPPRGRVPSAARRAGARPPPRARAVPSSPPPAPPSPPADTSSSPRHPPRVPPPSPSAPPMPASPRAES